MRGQGDKRGADLVLSRLDENHKSGFFYIFYRKSFLKPFYIVYIYIILYIPHYSNCIIILTGGSGLSRIDEDHRWGAVTLLYYYCSLTFDPFFYIFSW